MNHPSYKKLFSFTVLGALLFGTVLAVSSSSLTQAANPTNTAKAAGAVTKPVEKPSVPDTKDPAIKEGSVPCTGVLVKGCASQMGFGEYVEALMKEVLPLALFFAMIMIAWSGVQYMLSGFHPDQATKAKQRIVGVIVAAVFLLAVSTIASWVSPEVHIDKDAQTTTPVKK